MENKCVELSSQCLPYCIRSKKYKVQIAKIEKCEIEKKIYVFIVHGIQNKRFIGMTLATELDQFNRHAEANTYYRKYLHDQFNLNTVLALWEPDYSIVLSGFGLSGTFCEYLSFDVYNIFKNHIVGHSHHVIPNIYIITLASPRGGNQIYYQSLRQIAFVRHHDWNISYPGKIFGFHTHDRTLWEGERFRIMGITIFPKQSRVAEQFKQLYIYMHNCKKLVEHISKSKPCDF